jgi:large subunit ribosomal protein L14e
MYAKPGKTTSEVRKMSLFEVGRLAVKIAGRDAGRKCVVVEKVDDTFVVVDGNVRRKKVNVRHLEPLAETVDLKSGANHADVKKVFDKLEMPTWEKKSKKAVERPRRVRKVKVAPKPTEKVKKVEKKAEEPKVEEKKEEEKSAPKAKPEVAVEETPKAEEKPVEKASTEKPAAEKSE